MLNMSEGNQGYLPETFASVPVKRKRGRPRKYPRTDVDQAGSAHIPRIQNLIHGGNVHIPPVIVGANGNHHHQADPASTSSDSMIGQLVHGVVEAAFDAGYLLAVRVGDSDTTLRGVVFKPGHFVPLSARNDVAPEVPMIRRKEVPVPAGNYAWNAYPVSSAGKQIYNAGGSSAPSGSRRGNVVPVVLQPINATNGIAASTQFSNQIGTSKGKEVLHVVDPQNGATSMHGAASVPMEALPTMPFETLLTEVMKRVQVPPQSMETNSSSADKLNAKDPEGDAEDDDDDGGSDSDQALSVEPLQAVQPGLPVPPIVVSRPLPLPLESYGPGKMTELLQVLQDNVAEKQAARTDEQTAGSSQE